MVNLLPGIKLDQFVWKKNIERKSEVVTENRLQTKLAHAGLKLVTFGLW